MKFVYLVDDDSGPGTNPDLYGVFSTRELAEGWIKEQRELGYAFTLHVTEYPLDRARNLR
jgi:hypothetical protein